jgi:hypothetical protein
LPTFVILAFSWDFKWNKSGGIGTSLPTSTLWTKSKGSKPQSLSCVQNNGHPDLKKEPFSPWFAQNH